jgi:hypothetical protein
MQNPDLRRKVTKICNEVKNRPDSSRSVIPLDFHAIRKKIGDIQICKDTVSAAPNFQYGGLFT